MSEQKIKGSDLEKMAAELKAQGKLPDLDTVLSAVADTRKKYRHQILASREHPGLSALEKEQK
jgi:hypothetical protein